MCVVKVNCDCRKYFLQSAITIRQQNHIKLSVIQIFQHKLPQPSSARFVTILEDLDMIR